MVSICISADGRGFAISGGVAQAVVNCIKEKYPDVGEVKVERAEGLDNCRKMMMLAKAGKYNGYLLEGMACPGGCVGGAGTIVAASVAEKDILQHKKISTIQHALQSNYQEMLDILETE